MADSKLRLDRRASRAHDPTRAMLGRDVMELGLCEHCWESRGDHPYPAECAACQEAAALDLQDEAALIDETPITREELVAALIELGIWARVVRRVAEHRLGGFPQSDSRATASTQKGTR